MTNELRRIAVYVDEAVGGGFSWVLIEQTDGRWRPLERAVKPVPVYQEAMAAGLLALQALVEDLRTGPRAANAEEDPQAAPAEEEEPARKASLFGFGPAR